jgi:two-component system OmpR family sensor kinase
MHTPEGTNVRLRAVRLPSGAVISVEDDGPGIPREQREHVFERFYRGDGSQASGSGLGLAIAQELAEAMGGTLELESRPGRTVFSLVLPSAEPEVRRAVLEAAPLEA